MANTWDTIEGVWNPVSSNPTIDTLASAVETAINIVGDSFDIVGTAMPSMLEKATMDLGEPDQIKIVKSVTPRITGKEGTKVYIRVGMQFSPDDAIAWSGEELYTIGGDREVFFTEKGRFVSIRMRTQDIGVGWKCHGFYIKVAVSGKY